MNARSLSGAKPQESIESFRPGDTVTVNVKIREGERERVQAFQGNVIVGSYSKGENPAPGANFIVRRISYGVGVERIFPICSPMLESVKVVRKGDVRRARLYYLRGLTGRAARIKERRSLLEIAGAGKKSASDMGAQAATDAIVPTDTVATAAVQPAETPAPVAATPVVEPTAAPAEKA